jgi:hypothetical protein
MMKMISKTIPSDVANDDEIKAMKVARMEYLCGEFVTLDQIFNFSDVLID